MGIKIAWGAVIFLVSQLVAAQTQQLQISAELRPRFLIDGGYKTPKAKNESISVFTTQRTRLNAMFLHTKFESYMSVQDVRLWGDDNHYNNSGVYGHTESLCLHQAWVKLNITKPLSFKIGRQVFSYDDQRILSARNWNDYQVTYDALLAEYHSNMHRLHLALTYNSESKSDLIYSHKKFKTLDFIHYQYQAKKLDLSAIAVLSGNTFTDSSPNVLYRGTYGVNLNYTTASSTSRMSAYYQHKLNRTKDRLSAFCISAYTEGQLSEKIKMGLGYDYLSGNTDACVSTANHRFDILYGRRHGWYGYMDYFSTIPQQGLQDYMLKLTYVPDQQVSVYLHYHYFMLAEDKMDCADLAKVLSRKLGQELDLKIKWNWHDMATLECGYCLYATTHTLKKLKKHNNVELRRPQFCYMMLIVKPFAKFNSTNGK